MYHLTVPLDMMTTHVVEFLVNLLHLSFVDIPKAWLPTDVTPTKTL